MGAMIRVVVVVLLMFAATPALAQDTGSSIGGSNWSGGGGGGGGGGGYSGGGSDYSYSGGGGSDYSSSSSGSGGGGGRGCSAVDIPIFLAALLLVGGVWLGPILFRRRSVAGVYHGGGGNIGPSVDVTVLRIGLDARVRPHVQKELDRIARVADTATPAGLLTMLHEVALLLRRLRDAWVYGGAHNHAMGPRQVAQGEFQQQVAKARSTFRDEMVRATAGEITTGERSAARAPRSDEGAGLVMVTLIVAARQELFTVKKVGDGQELRRALEVLSALTAHSLAAVEIVWTPSDPDDRMSSIELEALLPGEVFRVEGAMVGKTICAYCAGPFPAELVSCPHCGAPARESRDAA